MASEEKTDTKQEKRGLDVTTVVKRLPLLFFYTLFANYFFMLFSLGFVASFVDLRGLENALPIYLWEFPVTFAILTWVLTRKRSSE